MGVLVNFRTGKQIISFSGGQDSSTCLLLMLQDGIPPKDIYTVSYNYGQRHGGAELVAQVDILNTLGIPMENRIASQIPIMYNSALTDVQEDLNKAHKNNPKLPASFVPGRNLLFGIHTAQIAYDLGIDNLIMGVNAVDYSGYPDCRPSTIWSLEETIQEGFGWSTFRIFTPLINATKSEIILSIFGHPQFKSVMASSHTCYKGIVPGCGICPACEVRAKGFADAGILDPRFEL